MHGIEGCNLSHCSSQVGAPQYAHKKNNEVKAGPQRHLDGLVLHTARDNSNHACPRQNPHHGHRNANTTPRQHSQHHQRAWEDLLVNVRNGRRQGRIKDARVILTSPKAHEQQEPTRQKGDTHCNSSNCMHTKLTSASLRGVLYESVVRHSDTY